MVAIANPFEQQLDAMRKAFGAPGDHGYGTKEGDALLELYRFLAEGSALYEADKKDAARFRYLCENHVRFWTSHSGGPDTFDMDFEAKGHDLDTAIDAAMGASS